MQLVGAIGGVEGGGGSRGQCVTETVLAHQVAAQCTDSPVYYTVPCQRK